MNDDDFLKDINDKTAEYLQGASDQEMIDFILAGTRQMLAGLSGIREMVDAMIEEVPDSDELPHRIHRGVTDIGLALAEVGDTVGSTADLLLKYLKIR